MELTLLFSILFWIALKWTSKKTALQKNYPWVALFINAVEKPLKWWILASLAAYLVHLFVYRFFYTDVIGFLAILAFIWFLLQLRRLAQRRLKESSSLPSHYISTISYFFSLAILLIAALLFLRKFGFSVTELMVVGGGGGILLGVASKGFFTKFLSGMMLNLTNPFQEKERIYLPALKVEGDVEKIGLGRTRLRDSSKIPIYLSNKYFADSIIVNVSRRTHRPLDVTFAVPLRALAQIPALTDEIRTLLVNSSLVDPKEEVLVAFYEFGSGAAKIMVYAMLVAVREELYRRSLHEILGRIGDLFQKHGMKWAFPLKKIINER